MTAVLITLFTLIIGNELLHSPSTTVVLAENDNKENSIVINTKSKQTILDKPNQYVSLSENKKIEIKTMSKKDVYSKFKNLIDNEPKKPVSILLYFKIGGSSLTEESKEKISTILDEIASRKSVDLSIIGHTDTVGSNEYNAKLSIKRARLVKELIFKNKIKVNTLKVESYGENDLLIETADNVPKKENRRVEVLIK